PAVREVAATRPAENAGTQPANAKSSHSGVDVYPAAVKSENEKDEKEIAKPETLRAATTVRGIRTEQVDDLLRVFVDTDGIAQYKDFTLTNPNRIVIDLKGVRS